MTRRSHSRNARPHTAHACRTYLEALEQRTLLSTATIYSANMDTDPGWTLDSAGLWQYGHPNGTIGPNFDRDPSSGYTGNNVIGVNLNGIYSSGGPYYATTPAINCTNFTGVHLDFARWLNTDTPQYAPSTIDVSNDGTSWTNIWTNPSSVQDNSWQLVDYDISAVADNHAAVYIRWGYKVNQNAFTLTGWNIDDVVVSGTQASPPPTVTAVYVNSSAWSQPFLNSLAAANLGDATYGFRLSSGANQLKALPYSNINQLTVQFSENVTISQAALTLAGLNLPTYGSSNFNYNTVNHTATWTLTSFISTDKLQLTIPAASVTDAANNTLDGEWTDGTSTSSGNGAAGGNFVFHFNVLPGDLNQSGTVDLTDLTILAGNWQQNPPNPLLDTNGDNFVDLTDLTILAGNWQSALPAGSFPAAAPSLTLTPATTTSTVSTATPTLTNTHTVSDNTVTTTPTPNAKKRNPLLRIPKWHH